jgi:hypothetical protein
MKTREEGLVIFNELINHLKTANRFELLMVSMNIEERLVELNEMGMDAVREDCPFTLQEVVEQHELILEKVGERVEELAP